MSVADFVAAQEQRLAEPGGCALREFRCGRIDYRQNARFLPWECLQIGSLMLPPRKVVRNQVVDVGVDGEVLAHKESGVRRHPDRDGDYKPPGARAKTNNADKQAFQHRFNSLWRWNWPFHPQPPKPSISEATG